MSHMHNHPSTNYVNIWCTVTVMKLTESSASLCSFLNHTLNIPLTTLLTKTINMCSSYDLRNQISHPHKMTWTMQLLTMRTQNILNWMVVSIAWTYCSFHPPFKIIVLLTFCQDLTYLKPHLPQSDSGTSQAMCHKIQITQDITVRTVQNPSSTVQLLHEYRLAEKPEILNIC